MTTARDVIAEILCELDALGKPDDLDREIADLFIDKLVAAPESVRMELVALLNPWSPIETVPKTNQSDYDTAEFVRAFNNTENARKYDVVAITHAQYEMLMGAAKAIDEQITAIHAAFGAPGDYGYESREGKALFALYRFQSEQRATLRAAGIQIEGEQDGYRPSNPRD